MDPAVALVQAYLQLNGYLTITEFPILGRDGEPVTDVDVIALRFPDASPLGATPGEPDLPDPVLGPAPDAMDLLVCEVKEGKGRLNRNLVRRETLRTVLRRVGCCPHAHVDHHVEDLVRLGKAVIEHPTVRCRARIALFAGRPGFGRPAALVVSLAHVGRQIRRFLREHESQLPGLRLTQPALAQLGLLAKLGVLGTDEPGARVAASVG